MMVLCGLLPRVSMYVSLLSRIPVFQPAHINGDSFVRHCHFCQLILYYSYAHGFLFLTVGLDLSVVYFLSIYADISKSFISNRYTNKVLTFNMFSIYMCVQVKADEAKTVFKAFSDPSGIRASGLIVGGEKYITLRADDRSIYGKKVSK